MAIKRLFLLTTAVLLLAVSCDLFLLPSRDRDNPNDPDNPVAPMQDLKAVALSRTEVLLTVGVPNPEDPQRLPEGFIIVRTKERYPDGPDDSDGETIKKTLDGATDRIEITDSDLSPDTVYRYSLWAFGAGELSEHYTYSGSNSAFTLDPSADLETINDFSAWPYAIDQVYLGWQYSDSGIEVPQSNLIVRKEGTSPPSDPFDGTTLYSGESRSSIRDYGLIDNTEYTYGIWPADEDGTPYQYGPSGTEPWFTSTVVIAPISISVTATDVVIVEEFAGWDGTPASLQVKSDVSPLSATLVRFDLDDLKDKFIGTVVVGELTLTTQSVSTPGLVELYRTIVPWDAATSDFTWGQINEEGVFYNDDDQNLSVFVDQAGEPFAWDISETVQFRADGFLFLGNTGTQPAVASFDPSGGSAPRYDLLYFGEP